MNFCVLEQQVPASTLEALRLAIQATETIGKKKVFLVTERAVEKLQENGYREPVVSETELEGLHLATFKVVPSAAPATAAPTEARAVEAAAPATSAAPAAKAKEPDPCAVDPPEEGKYAGEVTFSKWEGSNFVVLGQGKAAKPVNYKNWVKARFGIPLSRQLGEPVDIAVPHNQASAPATAGFKVHIWGSSGDGDDQAPAITKLFDRTVPCTDRLSGLRCSSDEYVELQDPAGTVFGAMNEHNLYLYWDAVHFGSADEAMILDQVLAVVLASVGKKPQAGSPEEDKLAEDRYVNLTKKRFETLEIQLKKNLADREAEIQSHTRAITEKIRQNQMDSIQLAGFLAKGVDLEILRTEFKTLRSLPHVTRVKVDTGLISVFTDMLYCQNPNDKSTRVIGRFRIILKQDGTVWFHNTTHKLQGMNDRMNAPHVYEDGHACLGSMSNVFPTLIANGEYSAAAQMAIAFLESVNVDDAAGRHINKWPERTEYEKKHGKAAEKTAAKTTAKAE